MTETPIRPRAALVVPQSGITAPCRPFIDAHTHVAELGRQPYAARRFFLRHADRILFGTDAGPDAATYGSYARFLESEDEYFSYSPAPMPGQGRWMVYGLNLPRTILDKVCHDNAARLFGLT